MTLRPALQLSGAVIAPVGLLFMAYALYMYRLRTYQVRGWEVVGAAQRYACW